MARKPKSSDFPSQTPEHKERPKYAVKDEAVWGGFVNIRLNDDHKKAFEAWYGSNSVYVWQAFEDILGQGMKVAFGYDPDNQCCIVTFTGRLLTLADDRRCVTSRHATPELALALAVWKHTELARGVYDGFAGDDKRFASFG